MSNSTHYLESSVKKVVAHLTSSCFLGGPERQILGLAQELSSAYRTVLMSFSEGGHCRDFLRAASENGHEAIELVNDTPLLFAARRELISLLRSAKATVICTHGYKADALGLLAARHLGIPAVAVSRGWTRESWKVRAYESLDRRLLRRMDRVVAVSEGQAAKVRQAGVPPDNVLVIRNSIQAERFADNAPGHRDELRSLFPAAPAVIVGAVGRLSPEKGFDVLVEAAAIMTAAHPEVGFALFGDGPQQSRLVRRIADLGLQQRFVLAGFRDDLDRFIPHFDLQVLPSYTEGLPNVVLESLAAGVPVVATRVGGTPEVVDDGVNGYLVPPGDARTLAERISSLVDSADLRRRMGAAGRERVLREFTFQRQAGEYLDLFAGLSNFPVTEVAC
jgi:glycosyltransferase involved in cell wall biosynthesis